MANSCVLCKKPVSKKYKPFCSKFCADRDLINWADGAYRIPTNEFAEQADMNNETEQ